jgi:hypothetical protein
MLKKWRRIVLPALLLLVLPAISMAQFGVGISVNLAPPVLPVYEQPPIPGDGYLWVPGYWYWSPDAQDYYWVPGTWVMAPQPGLLWTPGYWGNSGGAFVWNPGYWGPHVGFYGGVNYGYGYGGGGFEGAYWQNGHVFYNRSVVNVGTTNITNVYTKNVVVNNVTVNRVSYNGGSGGVQARPTAEEQSFAKERHVEATPEQQKQRETAQAEPSLRAKANGGHPPVAATQKPGSFSGAGVIAARGAPAHPTTAMAEHPAPATHPAARPTAPAPSHTPAAPEEQRAPEPAPHAAAPVHPAAPPAPPHPAAAPKPPRPPEHPPAQEHPSDHEHDRN